MVAHLPSPSFSTPALRASTSSSSHGCARLRVPSEKPSFLRRALCRLDTPGSRGAAERAALPIGDFDGSPVTTGGALTNPKLIIARRQLDGDAPAASVSAPPANFALALTTLRHLSFKSIVVRPFTSNVSLCMS